MKKSSTLTRREFSVQAALLMLGGAVITISEGCGGGGYGGGNPTGPSAPPAAGDKQGTVSANHGHTATIMAAQITAGNGLTLNIRGAATHDHSVVLSGDDVVAIRNGTRVTRTSSVDDAHDHDVTFN